MAASKDVIASLFNRAAQALHSRFFPKKAAENPLVISSLFSRSNSRRTTHRVFPGLKMAEKQSKKTDPKSPPISDIEIFGMLIKAHRERLGLKLITVSERAFGTTSRAGYVSRVENGKIKGIQRDNVMKLANAVGLDLDLVPESLLRRTGSPRIDDLQDDFRSLVAKLKIALVKVPRNDSKADRILRNVALWVLAEHIHRYLEKSPEEQYRHRLRAGLRWILQWTGRPFSFRSFGACATLSLLYVVLVGFIGFVVGGGQIGTLAPFAVPDWAEGASRASLAFFSFLPVFVSGFVAYSLLQPLKEPNQRPAFWRGGWRHSTLVCVLISGCITGAGALLSSFLGAEAIVVAAVFAVVAFAAISRFSVRTAGLLGAAGGVTAGVLAGSMGEDGFENGIALGSISGLIVGGAAGMTASRVAKLVRNPHIGALTGAGLGSLVGAAAAAIGLFVFLRYGTSDLPTGSISSEPVALFLVVWLILPITNACVDYLSLGVSHCFGRYVLSKEPGAGALLVIAVVDALIAVILAISTLALISFALSMTERLIGGAYSVASFPEASMQDPFGSGFWLTAMILSTMTWTLLHYVLVVMPAISTATASILLGAMDKRRAGVDDDASDANGLTWMVLTLPMTLIAAVAVVFLSVSAIIFYFLLIIVLGMLPAIGLDADVFGFLDFLASVIREAVLDSPRT